MPLTTPPLTNQAYLKRVLDKAHATPKRSLGQNFLVCTEVVEATLALLATGPKNVTELGAGVGSLTQVLVAADFSVRAIEKDDVLIQLLRKHAAGADIMHGDMKEQSWTWPEPYQLIGNIPYNLSGFIIRRLTQLDPRPQQAILLVQAEVGERLLAHPPQMSLLSLAVHLWGAAHQALAVPASCFWPQPKVASMLITLIPHEEKAPDQEAIMELAKICFQGKRKQIGGSLKRSDQYTAAAVTKALANTTIPATARPQELTAHDWRRLYKELLSHT